MIILSTGCRHLPTSTADLGPVFHPENVYKAVDILDRSIIRVAVLPMNCEKTDGSLIEGQQTVEPLLLTELSKARKFELCPVSPEALNAHTGRAKWSAEEVLPADLLSWITREYGCNAVLFSKLTTYRGYPPLAIGWRIRLVDCRTQQTIWSLDDVFDAGQPTVRCGARQYANDIGHSMDRDGQNWAVLNSPRLFGQYAAAETASTLPGR